MAAIPLPPPVGASAGAGRRGGGGGGAGGGGGGGAAGLVAGSSQAGARRAHTYPRQPRGRHRARGQAAFGEIAGGAAWAQRRRSSLSARILLFGWAGRRRMPLRGGRGPALPQGRGR